MPLTPVQTPNPNADTERWVRTVRAECLDWLLIIGRGHLEQVLQPERSRHARQPLASTPADREKWQV